MSKMLQVRNVPDDVHDSLRRRAAEEGMTLSEFVLRQLRVVAERPSKAEVLARAAARGGSLSFEQAAAVVSEDRRDRT